MDWVVNNETYGSEANVDNATQIALLLTLPKFWTGGRDLGGSFVPGYSYPEQQDGQMVYAVKGDINITPNTWALGSVFMLAMRIVKKPIEWDTAGVGVVITDANYSLFQPQFANERFLWQKVTRQQQAFGDIIEDGHVSWKGRCHLEPDEALWLIIENQSGITQRVVIRSWLRTLMRADE